MDKEVFVSDGILQLGECKLGAADARTFTSGREAV